jgi:hypothetical protein
LPRGAEIAVFRQQIPFVLTNRQKFCGKISTIVVRALPVISNQLTTNRAEFSLNGLRNRDLRSHLYPATKDKQKQHRQMAAVGRRLRLLRAHGLIAKVPKTHRYIVTEKGRNIITALLAARNASTEKLTALAA